MLNIPNLLTLFRIFLIPVFVILFYLPYEWSNQWAAGMFVVAAITDWFDGYLARRLNQSTPFGAFLDPVADKIMVMQQGRLVDAGRHEELLTRSETYQHLWNQQTSHL